MLGLILTVVVTTNSLPTVGEKYCPITRSWSPVANMYLARSNCTCAVLDDQLFVVGGYNGE